MSLSDKLYIASWALMILSQLAKMDEQKAWAKIYLISALIIFILQLT